MPPPVYWNGRFSSGPVWNEYLSLLLNFDLANHAVGMAKSETIHRKILNIIPLDPPTTQDQIFEFATNLQLGNVPPPNPAMDIAVLEIGSNDANAAFVEVSEGLLTIYEFAQMLSDIVVEQLQSLSDLGFRKILVTNLPALQHAPIVKSKGRARPLVSKALGVTDTETYCVGGSWINLFNDHLYFTDFMKYLVSSDSNIALCNDPGTKFFWDPVHPSERVH
ncbi:hypothetical protein FB639_004845, partial [Coemansia asiatica]